MAQVEIVGWNSGLKKVSVTVLLRESLALGLAEAKGCTDRVLDGEVVRLDVEDEARALKLARGLEELGAIVRVLASDGAS